MRSQESSTADMPCSSKLPPSPNHEPLLGLSLLRLLSSNAIASFHTATLNWAGKGAGKESCLTPCTENASEFRQGNSGEAAAFV